MELPNRSDLLLTFEQMTKESYNGIYGVARLRIGNPTRKVVIAALTHGDEPSGLGAFRFLLDNRHILKDVELILAVHNIDGGARWFQAATWSERHQCRALGWNFNRLPLDFPDNSHGPAALNRLRQLWMHVYPDTTHALDIHSADQPLAPDGLILDILGSQSELDRIGDVLPASIRFRGITELQAREGSRTKPVGTILGGPSGEAVAIEIESDSHESPVGIKIAVQSAIAMLTELGCISETEIVERNGEQSIFDVLGAVMVPSEGYRFVAPRLLQSFAPVRTGEPLLTGPQGEIRVRHSGHLIFAPANLELEPGDEKEEACFELSDRQIRYRRMRLPKWAEYNS